MKLKSLSNCKLAIGSYPFFTYNAIGGGGQFSFLSEIDEDRKKLRFNPDTFCIPTLDWRNTRIAGIPIPPGFKITLNLHKLDGFIEGSSGMVALEFEADFLFSIFSILNFPALSVKTTLNSMKTDFKNKIFLGKPIQSNGTSTLVGSAVIDPVKNIFLNIFLNLPCEALALLECEFVLAD